MCTHSNNKEPYEVTFFFAQEKLELIVKFVLTLKDCGVKIWGLTVMEN